MNFSTIHDFLHEICLTADTYSQEYDQSPVKAYIPEEDYDRLLEMVKDDPKQAYGLLSSMQKGSFYAYGICCMRASVSDLDFNAPAINHL
jgi:hypothetical protein